MTAAARPRRTVRGLIVLLIWWGFVLWSAWGTVSNLVTLLDAAFTRATPEPYGYGYAASGTIQAAILFPINLWALASSLLFGVAASNTFGWLNGRRLVFSCLAFAAMVGRLVSGLLGYIALIAPLPKIAGLLTLAMLAASPFILLTGGVIVILAFFAVIGALFASFVGIPVMLFNQIFQFEKSIAIYRYKSGGLGGYIARAAYWMSNQPLPAKLPDDSKGARLATRAEAIALHNASHANPARMVFGHWIPDQVPFQAHTEKHVLIMASTRSGKGVTLIIPHLLSYGGSAFVLDPKGENAKATGRRRAAINNAVHYLDPFGISGKPRSRFNPLARFTPDNMEAESKALAAAMFVVGDRQRDHWTAAGQQLLAAIILYVYVSDDVPKAKKDLPTVRKLLLGGVMDTLDAMTKIDAADGLLRDLATSFLETPEKERGSIISTAQRETEILDNPFMIACLSAAGAGPEVDFKAWHHGTMTVFLCLSAPKFPTFNRWLRLVLTSALDEMTDTLDPPKLPVCFMLDELATLGHLAAVENAVGLAAGYGIQLVSVFQDVAQMRDLYKGRWASFVGNAGVRALFNLDDYDTAEYWSKFIGGTLVETRGRQEDLYGYNEGDNVGEAMRPLLPPDKIMMDFASGQMLVLAQGAHPVITERVAYWADQRFAGLWDDPRAPATPPAPVNPPPPSGSPPAFRPQRTVRSRRETKSQAMGGSQSEAAAGGTTPAAQPPRYVPSTAERAAALRSHPPSSSSPTDARTSDEFEREVARLNRADTAEDESERGPPA